MGFIPVYNPSIYDHSQSFTLQQAPTLWFNTWPSHYIYYSRSCHTIRWRVARVIRYCVVPCHINNKQHCTQVLWLPTRYMIHYMYDSHTSDVLFIAREFECHTIRVTYDIAAYSSFWLSLFKVRNNVIYPFPLSLCDIHLGNTHIWRLYMWFHVEDKEVY